MKKFDYIIDKTKGQLVQIYASIAERNVYIYLGHSQLSPKFVSTIRNALWTPEGKPRSYKFVMYLACNTADNRKWMKAFAAKTFIGFKHKVLKCHVIAYDKVFWREVEKGKSAGVANVFAQIETVNDEKIRKAYEEEEMPMAIPRIFGNKNLILKR